MGRSKLRDKNHDMNWDRVYKKKELCEGIQSTQQEGKHHLFGASDKASCREKIRKANRSMVFLCTLGGWNMHPQPEMSPTTRQILTVCPVDTPTILHHHLQRDNLPYDHKILIRMFLGFKGILLHPVLIVVCWTFPSICCSITSREALGFNNTISSESWNKGHLVLTLEVTPSPICSLCSYLACFPWLFVPIYHFLELSIYSSPTRRPQRMCTHPYRKGEESLGGDCAEAALLLLFPMTDMCVTDLTKDLRTQCVFNISICFPAWFHFPAWFLICCEGDLAF